MTRVGGENTRVREKFLEKFQGENREGEGWRKLGIFEVNLGEKVKDDKKRLQKGVKPRRLLDPPET